MQKAEYPQRMCKAPIAGELNSYVCELTDLHPGPHATFSNALSVQVRDQWEQRNPDWRRDTGVENI